MKRPLSQLLARLLSFRQRPAHSRRVRPSPETLEDRLALDGAVSGQVFEDLNNNGARDANEPGLNGWVVQLLDNTGQVAATTTSADVDLNNDQTIDPITESGRYEFSNLVPGDYVVQQVLQDGWQQTFPGESGVTAAGLTSAPIEPHKHDHHEAGRHRRQDATSTHADHHSAGHLPSRTRQGAAKLKLPDLSVDTVRGLSDWYIEGNEIRFSQATPNLGRGRMELRGGAILADGRQIVKQRLYRRNGRHVDRQVGFFTHHPEHGHIHFDDYSVYNLRKLLPDGPDPDTDPDVGEIVATGGKVSFCLLDVSQVEGRNTRRFYRSCGTVQGISPGWMDIYNSSLEGQSIDLTNVLPGSYLLEAIVDPTNVLRESDETNNVGRVKITIPLTGRPGTYVVSITGDEVLTDLDFGNFLPGTISGTLFEDHDGEGDRDDGVDEGLADRTVYLDQNDNGVLDSGPQTFTSTDVPRDLPDQAMATSTLNVSGSGAIIDLNIKFSLTHTYDGDLSITLISPTGTRVQIVNRVGGSGDNFIDTVLDDEAAETAILGESSAPFTGTFRPGSDLSALDGEESSGDWTLEIEDLASADVGTLDSWSLTITYEEAHTHTDDNGNYQFTGLGLGSYRVRQVLPTGATQTTADPSPLEIQASGGAFTGIDFGSQSNQ